jgi:3-hydroxy-3-methylglutaryl CoA synthase
MVAAKTDSRKCGYYGGRYFLEAVKRAKLSRIQHSIKQHLGRADRFLKRVGFAAELSVPTGIHSNLNRAKSQIGQTVCVVGFGSCKDLSNELGYESPWPLRRDIDF